MAGDMFGVRFRPHDLRRHAATYASLAGVSIAVCQSLWINIDTIIDFLYFQFKKIKEMQLF
jgi:hypothetical protein